MPMKKGEVWFAEFPHEENPNLHKIRPVIVLDDRNLEEFKVLSVKVTSRGERDEYDVPILYWQKSKLRCPSVARVSKFVSLPKGVFKYKIGDLHEEDLELIETKFMEYILNN